MSLNTTNESNEQCSDLFDEATSEAGDSEGLASHLECSAAPVKEETNPDPQTHPDPLRYDLKQLEEEKNAIRQAVALIRPNRRKRPNPESQNQSESSSRSLNDSDSFEAESGESSTEVGMKIREHEAKISKLKYEQECLEEEHCANMELIAIKTSYYREKIRILKQGYN